MKTAVSLPDELFERVEEAARDLRLPRSQVVALALEEFLDRRRGRELLAQLNEVYADGADDEDRPLLDGWRRHHRDLLAREE